MSHTDRYTVQVTAGFGVTAQGWPASSPPGATGVTNIAQGSNGGITSPPMGFEPAILLPWAESHNSQSHTMT